MQIFDKNNTEELKKCLYNSYDHDAEIENLKCDYKANSIEIELYNPIFNARMRIIFNNICIVVSTKGNWFGSRETVISVTAEEDYSYFRPYLSMNSEFTENSLYLVFQMLSGDELHIVSKEVVIETIT